MLARKCDKQICARCSQPIVDSHLTLLMDLCWHEKCVICDDCGEILKVSCYSRNGDLFCKEDFYKYALANSYILY